MTNSHDVFRLPDLGEGLTHADIVAWHVDVGVRVVAEQPLLSVETDKAIVEIPSPVDGTVARLHGQPGDRVAVGDLLVEFGTAARDEGTVVGKLVGPTGAGPEAAGSRDIAAAAAPIQRSATAPGKIKASPAVRKLARELGVDLTQAAGTGPGGSISSADLQRMGRGGIATHATELRGVRRAMAERMADAHRRVVPATVTGQADIQAWSSGARPMPRLVRAIARASRVERRLNATLDDRHWRLELHDKVNLGIAVDTEDGLFVPVLIDVASRELNAIDAELSRLEQAVRARTIDPGELRGQTITLSNYGAVGGLFASMVVVPPQVAIVGAGRIFERVVLQDELPVMHRMLPLSITIDHRVVTGAEAGRFLEALVADLEQAD